MWHSAQLPAAADSSVRLGQIWFSLCNDLMFVMFGSVRLCTIVSAARLVAIIIAGFPEDCRCRAHATSTSTSTPSPPTPHTKCNPTNHSKLQAILISNNGEAYGAICSFGSLKKWACLHVINLTTHHRLHILLTVKGWNDYKRWAKNVARSGRGLF